MDIEKDWFSTAAGRKLTVVEIAKHLGVSRNTARTRLDEGLTSDEIITLARAVHINPVTALQELGKITIEEVLGFMDSDGTMLTNASPKQLVYQLAQSTLTADDIHRLAASYPTPIDDLAARRSNNHDIDVHALGYVADSSDDEEEGDPGDYEA